MMKQISENRSIIMAGVVVVLIAGAFLWWKMLYQPAVAARDSAQTSASAAQQSLEAAQADLKKAQQAISDAKKQNGGKFDDSIARLQLASQAIRPEPMIDDAIMLLTKYADQSGIDTNFSIDTAGESVEQSNVGGATPVAIRLSAAGNLEELKHFIALVESTVESKRGNLYVHGRLFNVVTLEMHEPKEGSLDQSGMPTGSDSTAGLKVEKGDSMFDITIHMYTSTFGGQTTDPNAANSAGVDTTGGATGAGATGTGATGTSATGTSATGTTGSNSSTTPGATTTPSTNSTSSSVPLATMPPQTSVGTAPSGGVSATTPTGSTGVSSGSVGTVPSTPGMGGSAATGAGQ